MFCFVGLKKAAVNTDSFSDHKYFPFPTIKGLIMLNIFIPSILLYTFNTVHERQQPVQCMSTINEHMGLHLRRINLFSADYLEKNNWCPASVATAEHLGFPQLSFSRHEKDENSSCCWICRKDNIAVLVWKFDSLMSTWQEILIGLFPTISERQGMEIDPLVVKLRKAEP